MVRNCFSLSLLLFGLFVSDAAPAGGHQLPPQVLLDQLLLRTERLLEADELGAVVEAMEEGFALAGEHELELPPDFRFKHARVTFAVGLLGAAKESVTEYLTASTREAESYLDAVGLLEDVKRILERRDAQECSQEREGSACWMELASHPGCYVWNPNPQPDEIATWTGECFAGFAQGAGTLTWTNPEGSQEHEANRRFGRPHGESVIRDSDGWAHEGPFVYGARSGRWISRFADGAIHEGSYVDGNRNGHWIVKDADGDIGEGQYVDGERKGHWVQTFTDGNVAEGPFRDGERNGRWVWKYPDGQVEEGPYVDGKRHGRWGVRPVNGDTFYVMFVRGVRQER